MWVAHKVICIFYHLRFGTSDLFSAKAMTSCKLASTKSVITEQQAPCQLPVMKPTLPPPADLSQSFLRSLTTLLICSEILTFSTFCLPTFFFNSLLRIFWQSDALQKPTKISKCVFTSPSVLFSSMWRIVLLTPRPPCLWSLSSRYLHICYLSDSDGSSCPDIMSKHSSLRYCLSSVHQCSGTGVPS